MSQIIDLKHVKSFFSDPIHAKTYADWRPWLTRYFRDGKNALAVYRDLAGKTTISEKTRLAFEIAPIATTLHLLRQHPDARRPVDEIERANNERAKRVPVASRTPHSVDPETGEILTSGRVSKAKDLDLPKNVTPIDERQPTTGDPIVDFTTSKYQQMADEQAAFDEARRRDRVNRKGRSHEIDPDL